MCVTVPEGVLPEWDMPLRGAGGRDWAPSRRSPGTRQRHFAGTSFKPRKEPDCPKGARHRAREHSNATVAHPGALAPGIPPRQSRRTPRHRPPGQVLPGIGCTPSLRASPTAKRPRAQRAGGCSPAPYAGSRVGLCWMAFECAVLCVTPSGKPCVLVRQPF
jgi:hypothetical protein